MASLIQEWAKFTPGMDIISRKNIDGLDEFFLKTPKERLSFAVRRIASERHILANQYDYAWLYAAIQERLLKGIEAYRSVESFRSYLKNNHIAPIPANSTISVSYGSQSGKFPEWKFTDCDLTESERRIMVVKRFLSLFNKGK